MAASDEGADPEMMTGVVRARMALEDGDILDQRRIAHSSPPDVFGRDLGHFTQTHRENWEEQVKSPWVLSTMLKGYKLQFHCRPPSFRGIRVTTMGDLLKNEILWLEISSLLEKYVIRKVEPSEHLCGFYSTYYVVPKKGGNHKIHPIFDLRDINLSESPEVQDVGSCTRVAFEFKVLPFGLSLALRTFTKCMDAVLALLTAWGIQILNYLDDWLVCAQPGNRHSWIHTS
ncbi:hypothetical protein AAFF_G00398320 [Aldrovandia affinis]|uniref:Reverse transcriptase n=1 Tax=Aldrovandia affinis TaxID=143900 RepID=A0AAD7WKG1_9TELE|nr:hypothetical protein AAFF_G00398320 [Aldrovandia affinis]